MADPRCIITAPLPVARGLNFGDLATIVAGDALVRRAWAVGRGAELLVPTLVGDLYSQYAFDRELAREGHDHSSVSADELAQRAHAFEEERGVAAAQLLARLSVTTEIDAALMVSPAMETGSRTAFVRLYEEGLVEEQDRVVATCSRCRTPVGAADTERGELVGERLTIRLTSSNGVELDVLVVEPELLPGAVAVAVDDGSPAAGSFVVVPIADREVPVVAGAPGHGTGIVVAAHDGEAYRLAQAHGLVAIPVLDSDGMVVCDGPLQGLGRYAAREAARELLDAEGVVIGAEPTTEEVWRCRSCGSVVVRQLARCWFLTGADLLEIAAADAVRQGLITFSPPDARDAFLASAGGGRDWSLSTGVPGGIALPVSTCQDCGKITVDVDPGSSCGKCMGELVAEPLFLDARFVAAVWPVVLGGWPGRRSTRRREETVAVVSRADLVGWTLPALALGLRLHGTAPFDAVIVHPWPDLATAIDDGAFVEDRGLDPRVLRLALVAGTTDLEVAAAAVEALDRPFAAVDAVDAAEAAAAGVNSLDECSPAQAASRLAAALTAGVPAEAAERLRALSLPILGD